MIELDDKKIKNILLSENYLTKEDLKKGEQIAETYSLSLIDALMSEGLATRELLGQAMAEYFDVPFIDINKEKIDQKLLLQIPESMVRAKELVAISGDDKVVRVGMLNPSDTATLKLIGKKLGLKPVAGYIFPSDLTEALSLYQGSLKEEFARVQAMINDAQLSREDRDELIIKIVDMLLRHGSNAKASDIHIEPYAKKITVRFRVDGVMHNELTLDKSLSELIVSRIKILAKLRTDEHRSSQDGKIRYQVSGSFMDIRVSIVPITEGENVVMRLLSSKTHNINLTRIGMSSKDLAKVKKAIRNPHGMILVTGPTGSGKTTTLYAVLNILNQESVHIATIEDPVEYAIEGISQIQVNNKTNLTFAEGLRAIVRQDPDIIMVGEIRDGETASIAVNSALTGHLVLSTLHTNDAATTLPRLVDMGVEPFLIASTVNVVIAQRLVRVNCQKCRVSASLTTEELMMINNEPIVKELLSIKGVKNLKKLNVYRGKGCRMCGMSGYIGRIGIFEVLEINDEIRDLIINKATSAQINKVASKKHMTSLLEDGLDKVLSGITTLDEVLRIVKA